MENQEERERERERDKMHTKRIELAPANVDTESSTLKSLKRHNIEVETRKKDWVREWERERKIFY